MAEMTFQLTGDVNVSVTVSELSDGTLQFDLVVLDDTGSIGDLNGLFFDIADDGMVDGLMVSGADVTDSAFNANRVTKVDGYNNVNGEVTGDYGKFDGGVQFGTSGIGVDDIRETSFILSHEGGTLTLDDLLGQDFAVRLTSVGEEDGSRDDSLKIGGEAPTDPDPVDPVEPIDPEGPTDPVDPVEPIDPEGPTEPEFPFEPISPESGADDGFDFAPLEPAVVDDPALLDDPFVVPESDEDPVEEVAPVPMPEEEILPELPTLDDGFLG